MIHRYIRGMRYKIYLIGGGPPIRGATLREWPFYVNAVQAAPIRRF